MKLSVIIPVLDESAEVGAALDRLAPLRAAGHEVIVVDGGSRDDTVARARGGCDRVIESARGRATQMNAGARAAHGETLLFLHVDTRMPAGGVDSIAAATAEGAGWGYFAVTLSGTAAALRVIEAAMNLRSRLTGVATGDQALFVGRALFERAGGFPEIELMEDIALCSRLRRAAGRPRCLRQRVMTSSRRWERHGIARTVVLMWRLRLAYWLGVDPAALRRDYDPM